MKYFSKYPIKRLSWNKSVGGGKLKIFIFLKLLMN